VAGVAIVVTGAVTLVPKGVPCEVTNSGMAWIPELTPLATDRLPYAGTDAFATFTLGVFATVAVGALPAETVPCAGGGTFIAVTGAEPLAAARCSRIGIRAKTGRPDPANAKNGLATFFIDLLLFTLNRGLTRGKT
jgi:hypothetical protein